MGSAGFGHLTEETRQELGRDLLQRGRREYMTWGRVGGAYRHTARRLRRAAAMMLLGASLVGVSPSQEAEAARPDFGFFGAPGVLATKPQVGDLDGDGDLDVLATGGSYGPKGISFFENRGSPTEPRIAPPVEQPFGLLATFPYAPPSLSLVDIDGDGDLDVIAPPGNYTPTKLFRNIGVTKPVFAPPTSSVFGLAGLPYYSFVNSFAFGDFDGDGDLDAVLNSAGSLGFVENTGSATAPAFATAVPADETGWLPDDSYATRMAVTDIDGDGDLDMFAGLFYGRIDFWENTGSASAPAFGAKVVNPFGLDPVMYSGVGGPTPSFADIDGDGDFDLLLGTGGYGYVPVFGTLFVENTGSATLPAFAVATPPQSVFGLTPTYGSPARPALADIDGDGDLDLFSTEDGSGVVEFFENTGTVVSPAFAAGVLNPFGLPPVKPTSLGNALEFADLDGDGDLDVLLAADSYTDTILVENTGTATSPAFAPVDVGAPQLPGPQAALIDIDGDGDLDAFSAGFLEAVSFSENTGSASAPEFASGSLNPFGITLPSYVRVISLEGEDIDGDGDFDLLASVRGNSTNYWGVSVLLENTGTITSPAFAAVEHPFGIPPTRGEAAAALGDIDGDGDLDTFLSGDSYGGSTYSGRELRFFEQRGSPPPPSSCPATMALTCEEGFQKARLTVNERRAGRERIVARLVRGPQLSQADFGNPASGETQIDLCIYDDQGDLVAGMHVARAGLQCLPRKCWQSIGAAAPPDGNAFIYRDLEATWDGVDLIRLKAGDAGKSAVKFRSANDARRGEDSAPTQVAEKLTSTSEVTVQVHSSDASCVSATLDQIVKQDSDVFKAK